MSGSHDYIISCCSTCDLTGEHLASIDVRYLPFHFFLDGKEYPDDLGVTVSYSDFYTAMANGADTSTSQVSVGEYTEFFASLLKEGHDVLHIAFSSGLSGSYSCACKAAEAVLNDFPDRKLYVVDSLAASSGYGLLVDKAAELRDEGYSIDALRDWTVENRLRVHHWFYSTDLTFFVKGGRVSKIEGVIGGMLSICPLLHVSSEGKLVPVYKLRGRRRAAEKTVSVMLQYADGGENYSDKVYMSNSACADDAESLASMVKEKFPHIKGDILINSIGTTIGSHTGPGTVALFFWGEKRTD